MQTQQHPFLELQHTLLPSVPQDTKLSKLDVLPLTTTYTAHLNTEEPGDHSQSKSKHVTRQQLSAPS